MPSALVVILTREHEDNLALLERLNQLNIETLEYPCIATRLIPFSGKTVCSGQKLEDFKVIAFASKRGVAGMRPVAAALAKNSRIVMAAVGEATARAFEDMAGRKADIVAESQTGEGLAKAIIAKFPKPVAVLYVQGNKTTGEFKDLLLQKGFEVCDLKVYENFAPEVKPLKLDRPAIAVFASPSAAQAFFAANSHLLKTIACVAIGPTTRKALVNLGSKNILVAARPGVEELVAAVQCLIKNGGKA